MIQEFFFNVFVIREEKGLERKFQWNPNHRRKHRNGGKFILKDLYSYIEYLSLDHTCSYRFISIDRSVLNSLCLFRVLHRINSVSII